LTVLSALVLSAFAVFGDVAPVHACMTSHLAKRGDSWWSIAEKHGVSLNKVLSLNGATPSTKILVGDSVCVVKAAEKTKRPARTVTYKPKAVIQIIREEWPDELEERAIQIARRESKLVPHVVGIPNGCCYGLFQIYYRWHKTWLPQVGVNNPDQLLDPRLNARAAYRLYQRNNGWGPWE
jgi:hypothetical protein